MEKKTKGGRYDKRNVLNELTGREWIYFTNTIWITGYSTTAKKTIGFQYRKIHPSPKPPELMTDIIYFFTKRKGLVLDPFAGVGGALIGASLCRPTRNAVGVELEQKYVNAYKRVVKSEKIKNQQMICDDARNMLKHKAISQKKFDLILTDPPYSNMMLRKRTGQKNKLYGFNGSTPYTSKKEDIGNLSKEEFLLALKQILTQAVSRLKNKRYMVVFCKDFQPSEGYNGLLHAEVIKTLSEIEGMTYKGMRIWHDQATSLYPFGYPYSFVMNQMHQYVLVFRKEV